MFDPSAATTKKTRNRQRFKHLDNWIQRTVEYCQQQGIVIGSEREAYEWFERVQILEHGYATPPQEMANISAEKVKDEFGFHLFQSRWRQAKFPLRQANGKIIALRRFLPLGMLGWRDAKATIAAAQTEEQQYLAAAGLTAAAEQYKQWAQQCQTYLTQAQVLTDMASQPLQLLLTAPEDEDLLLEEGTDNDDTAE